MLSIKVIRLLKLVAELGLFSIKDILDFPAGKFNASETTVRKFINQLYKEQYLDKFAENNFYGERSKPKYQYKVNEKGKSLIAKYNYSSSNHPSIFDSLKDNEAIYNLFRNTIIKINDKEYKPEPEIVIHVLQFLLSRSNKEGVVAGIGQREISRLTGCKLGKVKLCIKALKDEKFIVKVTPGFTGFVGRLDSIYQLNLVHDAYNLSGSYSSFRIHQVTDETAPCDRLIYLLRQAFKIDEDSERFSKVLPMAKRINRDTRLLGCIDVVSFLNDVFNMLAVKVIKDFENFDRIEETHQRVLLSNIENHKIGFLAKPIYEYQLSEELEEELIGLIEAGLKGLNIKKHNDDSFVYQLAQLILQNLLLQVYKIRAIQAKLEDVYETSLTLKSFIELVSRRKSDGIQTEVLFKKNNLDIDENKHEVEVFDHKFEMKLNTKLEWKLFEAF